jgi:hypothetical protein
VALIDIGAMLPPGASQSTGIAINASGDVVGSYWLNGLPRAFRFRGADATVVDLNDLVPPGIDVWRIRIRNTLNPAAERRAAQPHQI